MSTVRILFIVTLLLWAFAFFALGCAIIFYEEIVWKESLFWIRFLPLLFGTVALAALASTHLWSVRVVTALSHHIYEEIELKERSKKEVGPLLFNRACAYCGHKPAPVVCSECDSVEWGNLSGDQLRSHSVEGADSTWAYAVFFAHHRFKVFAAVMSVVFVGILGFVLQVRFERFQIESQRLSAYRESARESIDAITSYRVDLMQLESFCGEGHLSGNGDEGLRSFCRNLFGKTLHKYFQFSWSSPPVLEYLKGSCPALKKKQLARMRSAPRSDSTGGGPRPAKEKSEIDTSKAVNVIGVACSIAEDSELVDKIDLCFKRYIQAYIEKSESRATLYDIIWRSGRGIGCVIDILGFGEFARDVDTYKSCLSDMQMLEARVLCPESGTVDGTIEEPSID